ncbi:hypothetical protein RJ55_05568 [Drechmeria coniospora]|nr:hypothetical protein RJ55_05568 [Drechmeria coniospora]
MLRGHQRGPSRPLWLANLCRELPRCQSLPSPPAVESGSRWGMDGWLAVFACFGVSQKQADSGQLPSRMTGRHSLQASQVGRAAQTARGSRFTCTCMCLGGVAAAVSHNSGGPRPVVLARALTGIDTDTRTAAASSSTLPYYWTPAGAYFIVQGDASGALRTIRVRTNAPCSFTAAHRATPAPRQSFACPVVSPPNDASGSIGGFVSAAVVACEHSHRSRIHACTRIGWLYSGVEASLGEQRVHVPGISLQLVAAAKEKIRLDWTGVPLHPVRRSPALLSSQPAASLAADKHRLAARAVGTSSGTSANRGVVVGVHVSTADGSSLRHDDAAFSHLTNFSTLLRSIRRTITSLAPPTSPRPCPTSSAAAHGTNLAIVASQRGTYHGPPAPHGFLPSDVLVISPLPPPAPPPPTTTTMTMVTASTTATTIAATIAATTPSFVLSTD